MKIQENHEIRRSKMVRGPQAATLIPALRRFELKLPNIFPRYYIFCFLISAFVSFLGTPEFCQKIVIFLKKWFLLKSLFLLRFGRNFVCELILATHLSVSTQNYPFSIFKNISKFEQILNFLKKVIFTQIAISAPIGLEFCLWAHISYTFKHQYSKLSILNF